MEQSVIELCSQSSRRPEGLAESSAGAGSTSLSLTEPAVLPRPVRLDPLVPEVTPNSLCSLTGQSHFQALWFHLIVLLCFLYPNLFCLYQGCPDPVLQAPRSSRVFCPTRLKTWNPGWSPSGLGLDTPGLYADTTEDPPVNTHTH